MQAIPLSLMMVIFTSSFCFDRKCHIPPESINRVLIKAQGGMSNVYINEEKFMCLCGQPGESVHIYPDQVLICCKEHRPTVK